MVVILHSLSSRVILWSVILHILSSRVIQWSVILYNLSFLVSFSEVLFSKTSLLVPFSEVSCNFTSKITQTITELNHDSYQQQLNNIPTTTQHLNISSHIYFTCQKTYIFTQHAYMIFFTYLHCIYITIYGYLQKIVLVWFIKHTSHRAKLFILLMQW